MSRAISTGSELAGYRIEKLLSRGGMGVVYLAEHLRLQRKVALKLLAPELSEDEAFRERFLRESQLAASLDHPNVVPIHDADEVDGQLYIAMRYVEGTDLRTLLEHEGKLDPRLALSIVSQVASALDAAHKRGLVHRDVKPANVLVTPDEHVYLSDFGLTKQASSQTGLTATGQLVGTVDYVAPEHIEGKPVDGRADVYSLGCLLYQCLAGKPPFARDSEVATLWAHIKDKPPKLDDPVDAVIAKALAKDPEQRYQTAGELAAAARDALGVSSGELPQLRPARRLNVRLVFPLALVTTVAVALGLFFALRGGGGGIAVAPNSVAVIDPKTNDAVANIDVGSRPGDIAAGEGGVWVLNRDDSTVSRIDTRARRVVRTIAAGTRATNLAVGAGGVWVFAAIANTLSFIDPTQNVLTASDTLPRGFGGAPQGSIAVGGGSVWVSDGSTQVFRVEPGSLSLRKTIVPDVGAGAVAFGAGGLWNANIGVQRIDPQTDTIGPAVQLTSNGQAETFASGALWIAISPVAKFTGGGTTSGAKGSALIQLDPTANAIVATVSLRAQPIGVAAGAGALWVAGDDGTVVRVDQRTNDVVQTIHVGRKLQGVTFGDGLVWVSVDR